MKKTIIAICSAIIILACNMLTPMTALAEARACKYHKYHDSHKSNYLVYLSSHPVYIYDPYGPVYENCTPYENHEVEYPKCSVCGHIDYSFELSHTVEVIHPNINCPLH